LLVVLAVASSNCASAIKARTFQLSRCCSIVVDRTRNRARPMGTFFIQIITPCGQSLLYRFSNL
jgi:hypothetical protein